MIAIIDYDVGNVFSIQNMLKSIGIESKITNDPSVINSSCKLILPGIGSFDEAAKLLYSNELLLDSIINNVITYEKPILGICLGMQLLTEGSEEGNLPGLGFIPGKAHRFDKSSNFRVPHMGWNTLLFNDNNRLFNNLNPNSRFYFAHSYYVKTESKNHTLAETEYNLNFASVINKANIYGVQFHPEKSHKFGMNLLKSFSEL